MEKSEQIKIYSPIDCDTAKMKNAGCAAHHITRNPKMTENRSPRPITVNIIDDSEWHHQTSHCNIGNSQAEDFFSRIKSNGSKVRIKSMD